MVSFGRTDLSEQEKVVLYAMGILDDLIKLDIVTQGPYSASWKGHLMFEYLKSSGYCPSRDELNACFGMMVAGGMMSNDDAKDLLTLASAYIDGRLEEVMRQR